MSLTGKNHEGKQHQQHEMGTRLGLKLTRLDQI